MDESPKNISIRLFIPGSSNVQLCPVLHENDAGPLIISRRKSSISNVNFSNKPREHEKKYEHTQAPILSTDETSWDTTALDFLAVVCRRICIVSDLEFGGTVAESTVERFHPTRPELERALSVLFVTTECDLWGSVR